ncbi:hypothetical protein ACSHWB_39390 [Lentzea sp. HUAS TT2]|uniref:hypothetical protein n=1 Tax=Lentzea sp. HUAS TT2 TaxID=3447454 RepID=UPI003F7140AF
MVTGSPLPPGLSAEEKATCAQLVTLYKHIGYAGMMGDRPQTLTGLSDSPIALATFLLDHDAASMALISRVFAGQTEGLSRDDVLDNITLLWRTNTGVSSGRLYWENKFNFFADWEQPALFCDEVRTASAPCADPSAQYRGAPRPRARSTGASPDAILVVWPTTSITCSPARTTGPWFRPAS